MDCPPSADPSVLEGGAAEEAPAPVAPVIPPPATRPTHNPSSSTASARSVTNRQPQPHQLLSSTVAARSTQAAQQAAAAQAQQQAAAPAPAPAAPTASNDLFSLDFHNPTPPASTPPPKKDVKQDILSLFSTAAPAAAPVQNAFGQYGGVPAGAAQAQNAWGQFAAAAPAAAPAQATSMMGSAGPGMWGVSSGWNAPAAPAQPNLWGNPAQPGQPQPQQNILNTNDIWASPGGSTANGGNMFASSAGMAKKDDVFGDIWGGFK